MQEPTVLCNSYTMMPNRLRLASTHGTVRAEQFAQTKILTHIRTSPTYHDKVNHHGERSLRYPVCYHRYYLSRQQSIKNMQSTHEIASQNIDATILRYGK